MMPFHPQLRGLLLNKIPQLTPVILDRYESLLGLYGHMQFVLNQTSKISSGKSKPREEKYPAGQENFPNHTKLNDEALKKIVEEAQAILEPVRRQYQWVCILWYACREYAMVQGPFLQIPTSIVDLIRFAGIGIKYHAIHFYISLCLGIYRILYHVKKRPKQKERA